MGGPSLSKKRKVPTLPVGSAEENVMAFRWFPTSTKNRQIEDLSRIIELQQEVATSELGLFKLMELICDRTQSLTEATGAVVEMAEGEEMVYRAATGTLRSSLGLRLNIRTSLSGQSVLTNEVLYCEDSETDPRVNREACRQVGARSMICVPLVHQSPVGVLKVISPVAHAFSDREVKILRLTAGLLSATIAHSITNEQRNEAMAALTASESKFRTLIHTAHEGIVISKDGVTLDANPSFCRMFGYDLKEIVGKTAIDYLVHDPRKSAPVDESPDKNYEFTARRKDGSHFVIEARWSNIDFNGERIRVSTVRDITEKKRGEQALRDSEAKSREAAQIKSSFLANMSHEIRTPLNGIIGVMNMLLDTKLDEEQKKFGEIINKCADSLLTIVNDVLDFSKIEANKMTLETIEFDLHQALDDVHQILLLSAMDKRLELSYSFAPDVPHFVSGDPTRLRQVLSNLVNNAIKFTAQGAIKIHVHQLPEDRANQRVRFEVSDTGIGIPESAIQQMFKPFSQVDASTTRRFGGTGLGLSICRQLVSMMNGEIGVRSKEGQGSTFWFTLTLPAAQRSRPSPSGAPLTTTGEKLRILIAEDNSVNQLIAANMIRKMGHTPTTVANGLEVIEALKLAVYDVILMDCQMPEMDGFEATRRIRAATADMWSAIPIIAMTAHALAGDREKCLGAGMNDYVAKPTVQSELAEAIKRTLGHKN